MEKPSKEIEKIMERIVKDGVLEKPSGSFTSSVMDAIAAKKFKEAAPVTPLISQKGWFVVFVLFCSAVGLLYFFPLEGMTYFSNFTLLEGKNYSLFSDVEFSRTMIYGIGFLSLFLIQILFLKRYLEKQF